MIGLVQYRQKLLRVEPDEIAINEFTAYLIRVAATCSGKYERGIYWEPSNYPISIGRVIVPGKKNRVRNSRIFLSVALLVTNKGGYC